MTPAELAALEKEVAEVRNEVSAAVEQAEKERWRESEKIRAALDSDDQYSVDALYSFVRLALKAGWYPTVNSMLLDIASAEVVNVTLGIAALTATLPKASKLPSRWVLFMRLRKDIASSGEPADMVLKGLL